MIKPLVYLITRGDATDADLESSSREILRIIGIAVGLGVSLVQIREKRLMTRSLFELTRAAAKLTVGSTTKLLVNDRPDIALAAGADGVHLASTSLPASVVRKTLPKPFLIGVSTHTLDETEKAGASGADFAVYGPVFSTPGKGEPAGVSIFADVCRRVGQFPVLAIGGIDRSNAESVIASGASGIAAIRALNDASSLADICHKLKG